MKSIRVPYRVLAAVFSAVLPVLWAAPSLCAQSPENAANLDGLSALMERRGAVRSAGPPLTLDEVERAALADNPDIHAALRRVAAAQAHVPVAGALDDPQLMYRGWGVPLDRPWNYNAAQNMIMVGQSLPGRGKRPVRTAVAQSDVTSAQAELEATRLRVRIEARKAYFDLLRAQEELRIHDEHVGIAGQAIQAAKIKYTVGKIPQVEVLKAQLALTRLAEHMIRFEHDAEVASGRLNTVLGRDPGAAIEVLGKIELTQGIPELPALEEIAMRSRPDLSEAAAAVEKAHAEQALTAKTMTPDFSVAAGYMLMPAGSDTRNNYMIEGSMTLPWLNRGRHNAEIGQASAAKAEKDADLDAMRNTARGQIQEALANARAAQRLARVYQDSLRPQAGQTLHAAVIAYENDQASFLDLLDSQMTVIDIDLAWVDAMAEFNSRMAELEMAVGAPLDDHAADEEKQ